MPDADPLIGKTLGPCRLDELIGRGGMGRVYKAHHLALDRPVAVKLVDVNSGSSVTAGIAIREQILAEARSAAKLEDPHIVAIYEVGEERGIPYIVMQWVDGETLSDRIKRQGPLSPHEALEIIRETAKALAVAHKAGLVHRDIKPGNILLDVRGGVKLADFGIARAAGVASLEGEAVAGSFHFMAPEQAYGGPPDPRSDLYALGTTWYFALTGQPPYPGSAMDALMRHRDEAPAEVRLLRPEITERAAGLLRRLMAKKAEERPSDAHALLDEMHSIGMLLETDTTGSPFKILPALPRAEAREIPPAVAPVPAPVVPVPSPARVSVPARNVPLPPPPPPPVAAAALGNKFSFIGLLAAFGFIAFGWQWRRAGPEDWTAGAAFLSMVPAALSFGDRKNAWRKVLSIVGCVAAVTCWARVVFAGGVSMPALEPAISVALGVGALIGSAYLGQWGQDRSEAVWSRVLGPAAAVALLSSALTWTVPETQSWASGLAERGAAWWAAFGASGGGWRWIGTAGVAAALGAAVHLKVQDSSAPKDRKLNWNK